MLIVSVVAISNSLTAPDSGEFVTRRTADVSVLLWWLAVMALVFRNEPVAKPLWVTACVAFVVHVVVAFNRIHSWSHEAAYSHVQEVSGFGPGIFISYLFGLLWLMDATWWLFFGESYVARSKRLNRAIHVGMAFIIFNGTIVYETSYIRYAASAGFLLLGCCVAVRLFKLQENRLLH